MAKKKQDKKTEKKKTKSNKKNSKKTNNKKQKKESEKKSGILNTYNINVDKAVSRVTIKREKGKIIYKLKLPSFGKGTSALLSEIRDEIIANGEFRAEELNNLSESFKIKSRFQNRVNSMIEKKVPDIPTKLKNTLSGILMQDMLGLGKIEFLLNDSNLEEIVVLGSKEPVRIYHKKYGWVETDVQIEKEDQIVNYANIIARKSGRQINVLNPLLDAHLISGDRANAVLTPISSKGNTITIRKFSRDPLTIIDLIKNQTVNIDIASLLWLAIEYELNVLISGGTASGKTSFLNACMCFIPPNQRLISIEDTRELMLPGYLYWCPLVTRSPNPEGKGEVSMLDLLVNSLRMRPDRIVLGEMRRKKEAEVLFESMHTGHSVYATVHANTAAETISRLTNPPLDVPSNLLDAVHLNVVMFRDRRSGIRRAYQIAEFISGKTKTTANILYRWVSQRDKIVKHNESMSFMEELSRHTAMSKEEIDKSLKYRTKIIKWMIKNDLRDLQEVGNVMNLYYTNREELDKVMKENNLKKVR
ncbi:MAG TPA: ATPase, T2SS/T4P/T4SS family [Candidatus Nanoarchaeia archaeon]|nr:ATPase, T2SS/T4P/T4SS family [Candidatus Nanoarchaeia archaeon]